MKLFEKLAYVIQCLGFMAIRLVITPSIQTRKYMAIKREKFYSKDVNRRLKHQAHRKGVRGK